jgi:hypothetical protein
MAYWAVLHINDLETECRKISADNLKDVLYILQMFTVHAIIVVETTRKEIVWKSNLFYNPEQHKTAFEIFLETFENK